MNGRAWFKPLGPGDWNAHQVVGHLFDVDIVYGFRWRLALSRRSNRSTRRYRRIDGSAPDAVPAVAPGESAPETRLSVDFGSLWHDVAVPDLLREGAATEIFERLDFGA